MDQELQQRIGLGANNDRLSTLRNRARRRISVLPAEACEETNITDVWGIKKLAQLLNFVKRRSTEVSDMLNTLREGHDASKALSEQMDQDKERADKAINIARKALQDEQEAKQQASEFSEENMNLQVQVEEADETVA